jgi:hypothetical protein
VKRVAIAIGLTAVVVALLFVRADQPVVRNLAPRTSGGIELGDAKIAALDTVRDLTIDGDKEDLVGISWMAVSRSGLIAITQEQDHAVRLYSPAGRQVARIGREGGGPGEFRDVGALGWVGDTLWVWDHALERLAYVLPDGTFGGNESVRFAFAAPADLGRFPAFVSVWNAKPIGDDRFLVAGSSFPSTDDGGGGIFVINSLGMILSRLSSFSDERSPSIVGAGGSTNPPFHIGGSRRPSTDGTREGRVSTMFDRDKGGTVRILIRSSFGDTLLDRSYPFVGVPITKRAADSVIDARAKQMPAMATALREQGPGLVPRFYNPVGLLMLGIDSTIWVSLQRTAEGWPWLVFDARGDPIGTVRLANAFFPHEASREFVWGRYIDENGFGSVVRYRLTPR